MNNTVPQSGLAHVVRTASFSIVLASVIVYSGVIETTSILGATGKINQDRNARTPVENCDNDLRRSIHDIGICFSAPFQMSNRDAWYAVGILSATGLAITVDEDVRRAAIRQHSSALDNELRIGDYYGHFTYQAILGTAVYVGGAVSGSRSTRETGRMLVTALAISNLTTNLLKNIVGRYRPYAGRGALSFKSLQFNKESTSFPSGHVSVAFTVSSVLSARLHNRTCSLLLYSLAGLTAIQRVYSDNHWLSDTFLAARIGIGTGHLVTRDNTNPVSKETATSMQILPLVESRLKGMLLRMRF